MTADTKRHVQFGLALVGFAALLGSVAGVAYGWVRIAAGALDAAEEPL